MRGGDAGVDPNRSLVVMTAMVAAIATAALLAINDPGIFAGLTSPGAAALEIIIYFAAVVLAMMFTPRCC